MASNLKAMASNLRSDGLQGLPLLRSFGVSNFFWLLVTSSKALAPSSDALVPSSEPCSPVHVVFHKRGLRSIDLGHTCAVGVFSTFPQPR